MKILPYIFVLAALSAAACEEITTDPGQQTDQQTNPPTDQQTDPPTKPEPVKLIMNKVCVTAFDSTSVTFGWESVAGASGYMVRKDSSSYLPHGDTVYSVCGLNPGTSVTVDVYATGDSVSFISSDTLSCSGATIKRPETKPKPINRGWFELPAQKDEDNDGIDDVNSDYYYSWTMRADAAKVRNFSCCYSKSKIHPVWVAAPLHPCYKGSSGRNDSYKDDPDIKCDQSAKFDGYTRGHMVGSSDRTVSVATNRQAFYHSNIGAQLSSGFNTGGGAWNNLEDLVDRKWCSDTLYEVIGCIFETFTDKYGNKVEKKTGTNSAKQTFQVPTAYYKVLLRTKAGNSGKSVDKCKASELQAVAFILAHRGNQKHMPCADDMYSVSYVESLTGLTFFVNVPNAPKATYSEEDWL